MVSIISMNVNKTKLSATKGFTIVHCRPWFTGATLIKIGVYIGVYKVYSVTRVRMGMQDIREIKIEVCTNTANGKPRLEVSGHAFEVSFTSRY